MPATVICFESFLAERDRRRAGEQVDEPGPPSARARGAFRDRLATAILNARQIAHRRAMLDFGNRRRRSASVSIRAATSERE